MGGMISIIVANVENIAVGRKQGGSKYARPMFLLTKIMLLVERERVGSVGRV